MIPHCRHWSTGICVSVVAMQYSCPCHYSVRGTVSIWSYAADVLILLPHHLVATMPADDIADVVAPETEFYFSNRCYNNNSPDYCLRLHSCWRRIPMRWTMRPLLDDMLLLLVFHSILCPLTYCYNFCYALMYKDFGDYLRQRRQRRRQYMLIHPYKYYWPRVVTVLRPGRLRQQHTNCCYLLSYY